MNPYEYKVSLRIIHPNIDPQIISNTLGIKPSRCWQAGTSRATPSAKVLEGVNKNSYWTAQLSDGHALLSTDVPLEDYLLEKNNLLMEYSQFFNDLIETQGKAEYFIGIFADRNIGCEFSSKLLKSLSNLGLELSLDIYPNGD